MERKGDFISTTIRYKKETEVVTFQGREITLENLSPVFTPEQEAVILRDLEQQLFERCFQRAFCRLCHENAHPFAFAPFCAEFSNFYLL